MKLIILESVDPYINLAIEEYLFNTSKEDIIMLWQNDNTVVIGKNQNAYAEINKTFTTANAVKVARRISGGGAVYHDLGNVNYTFISDKSEQGIDFKTFTAPIINAIRSLGIDANLTGRNDIEVDGKKISGNAQHVKGNRVLHHGTLLFSSNLSILSNALNVDEEKIKAKAIKSTRSRVINLIDLLDKKISVKEFIDHLKNHIINEYGATLTAVPENEEITKLYDRNCSEEWIYPKSDFLSSYTVHKKQKYQFGLVELYIEMKNDVILDIKILGDFFSVEDISILEKALKKQSIHKIQDLKILDNINNYINGMNKDDFLTLII